jgi:hypothetical protein
LFHLEPRPGSHRGGVEQSERSQCRGERHEHDRTFPLMRMAARPPPAARRIAPGSRRAATTFGRRLAMTRTFGAASLTSVRAIGASSRVRVRSSKIMNLYL